jgi:hypothetical protein
MEITIEEVRTLFTPPTLMDCNEYSVEEIVQKLELFEKSQQSKRGAVGRVFNDWKEVMESRSKMDSARETKIKLALNNYGFSEDDLKLAIRGCASSKWHMGNDPNNKKVFNSIELIFRNSDKIEYFKNMAVSKGIKPDDKIRKSNYDGSKPKASSYTEFVPSKKL